MSKETAIYLEDSSASVYTLLEQLVVNPINGAQFKVAGVNYWSAANDLQEVVMPNGVLDGGIVTPGTANNTVNVTEITCWLNSAQVVVSASIETIIRGTTNGFIVNAITIDNAGALAVVAGTEFTAFSSTRGAAGGPPYIPVDSVLVAMIYLTSITSSQVLTTEIKQNGQNKETAQLPTWEVIYSSGTVQFSSALPLIHIGDVPKNVYASYANIEILSSFTKLTYTDNFKIPEEIFEKTETAFHDNKKLIDVSSALTGGTFDVTFKQDSGIGSLMSAAKGDKRWLLVYPNQYRSAYFLCPPSVVSFERDAITAESSSLKASVTMLSEEPALELSN